MKQKEKRKMNNMNDSLDLVRTLKSENEILEEIKAHPNIKYLYLQSSYIGTKTCKYLSKNKTITYLNIGDTLVRDNDLFWISKMKNLQQLVCWNNEITDVGCAHIVKNKNITRVNLYGNRLDDKSCVYLMSSSICSLEIEQNPITEKGVSLIFKNKTIINLDFYSSDFVDKNGDFIMKKWNWRNKNLALLSISTLNRYRKFLFLERRLLFLIQKQLLQKILFHFSSENLFHCLRDIWFKNILLLL